MNFKQIIQDYFTFSRNERKGITILLVIIFLLAIANKVIFYFETPAKIDVTLLDSAQIEMNQLNDSVSFQDVKKNLFRFNPNTINRNALDSLSVPDEIKRNILKFRAKGGKFLSKADFRKIYGVTDLIYIQIAPLLMFELETAQPELQKQQTELFSFDPNLTSDVDFLHLGLTEKQIKTIRNYQSRGGTFRNSTDFFKIYGLTDAQKKMLSSFVVIGEKENQISFKLTELPNKQIEINSADSTELIQLPGIGDKLSKRIVKYRDLLGGFYSLSQLREVYGLSEQVIQQIDGMVIIDIKRIQKVDLNFANWNELAKHPYIKKELASKIIKFRTKYGNIHQPSVLLDSMVLTDNDYEKLRPYF